MTPHVALVPTVLELTPLIPTLFRPQATLRRADTGAVLVGITVTFCVGGQAVCTAETDEEGVAECPQNLVVAIGTCSAHTEPTSELAGAVAHAGLL